MLSVFRRKGAAGFLTALLALPVGTPLACEVPSGAAIDQLDGDRMTGFETARIRGLGEALKVTSATELHHTDRKKANTRDDQNAVTPAANDSAKAAGTRFTARLKPLSWNVFTLVS